MTVSGATAAANPRQPALVTAMMRPEFYPAPAAGVELKQTHISYVFIAGDWVYKIKKPVRFDFLDCSTLERRLHFCREEVRLNARLAPGIYAGVCAIVPAAGGFALGPLADGAVPGAVEYAVQMRRLPDDRMLDRLVAAGRADRELMVQIADRIAAFHAAAGSPDALAYGSAAAVWELIVGNLAPCERFIGDSLAAGDLAAIETFCRGFIAAHWGIINDRARRGRVREGHGDLRCEHVCVRGAEIDVIDCVEFSERLRCGDVASDVAFLAMDLDRLGAPGWSDDFVGAYARSTGDDEIDLVLPLYKCYRAVVRGKVESLRSREPEVDPAARVRARELARACFALAIGYARAASPALLIVCGKSGAGKSTIARMLRRRLGFEVISSDRVRKRLAKLPPESHVRAGYREQIYSNEFTQLTYAAMLAEAESILRAGRGAILDATYRDSGRRRAVLDLAARVQIPTLFVECVADENEVLRRLASRISVRGEVSDATPEIYLSQRTDFSPIAEIPAANHIVVDTTRDLSGLLNEIADVRERLRCAATADCVST